MTAQRMVSLPPLPPRRRRLHSRSYYYPDQRRYTARRTTPWASIAAIALAVAGMFLTGYTLSRNTHCMPTLHNPDA